MSKLLGKAKNQKSQLTKTKILQVAKLIFAEKGFHHARIKDIASRAGLGYGTFYLYFKDKKDVFYALFEQVEEELFTAADGGSDLSKDYNRGFNSYRALRKDLKAILKSFCENDSILKFSKELALIDSVFAEKYASVRKRLIKRTKKILEKSGLKSVDLDVAAIAIAGMIESTASSWDKLDSENILPTLTKLYFKAVS